MAQDIDAKEAQANIGKKDVNGLDESDNKKLIDANYDCFQAQELKANKNPVCPLVSLPKQGGVATFGMSWFWFPDALFTAMCKPNALSKGDYSGVFKVRVGYSGGVTEWPDYQHVRDHTEAIQIWFDGTKEMYIKLLGEFFDEYSDNSNVYYGNKTQYQKKIWYANEEQKKLIFEIAKKKGKDIDKLKPYVSELSNFYLAETYHQKFNVAKYKNNKKSWDFTTFDY